MPLEFENYLGERLPDQVALKAMTKPKKAEKKPDESYHKGWRVKGIPPGELEEAGEDHRRVELMARKSGGKEIKPFDPVLWLQKRRLKAVRSKPYEIHSSALECAAIAEKNGWLRVRVDEIKKAVAPQPIKTI